MDLRIVRYFLLSLPIAVALFACSSGRYQLRHFRTDLAAISPVQWLAEFFLAFFLVFLLTSTVAVFVSALPGWLNKLAGLGGVLAVMGVGVLLEAFSFSGGFFDGGMAQFISELPYVIGLFGIAIPLLFLVNSGTVLAPQDSASKTSRARRIIQISLIVIGLGTLLSLQNIIRYRFTLFSKPLASTHRMDSSWSQAFFEYPHQMSGSSEAIGMFVIGLAAYVMIPLGFALSFRHWLRSLFVLIAIFAVAIGSYVFIQYLGLSANSAANTSTKIAQADATVYVIFFLAASIPYYAFGFITGKLFALSTPLKGD
jgi:hypothetical protein